ncbi:Hypothetical protein FKW44_007782 [Caligus rogercresseyi]|uniref:Uncharacterized protein n=1 Tax=Caligus rogercresseyi TaxID=217165 RepID=A0A7T8KF76_CALRO|nr:Hypothetical protein FKW44_007782 [Caligus rogercresseyi]
MSISFTCLSVRLVRWTDKRDFSLEKTLSQSTEVIGAHEKRNGNLGSSLSSNVSHFRILE